mgnify:FL=1
MCISWQRITVFVAVIAAVVYWYINDDMKYNFTRGHPRFSPEVWATGQRWLGWDYSSLFPVVRHVNGYSHKIEWISAVVVAAQYCDLDALALVTESLRSGTEVETTEAQEIIAQALETAAVMNCGRVVAALTEEPFHAELTNRTAAHCLHTTCWDLHTAAGFNLFSRDLCADNSCFMANILGRLAYLGKTSAVVEFEKRQTESEHYGPEAMAAAISDAFGTHNHASARHLFDATMRRRLFEHDTIADSSMTAICKFVQLTMQTFRERKHETLIKRASAAAAQYGCKKYIKEDEQT